MEKNTLVVIIACIMFTWIVCDIGKASRKESKNNDISNEKVENLSSSELQEVASCVNDNGYCFMNNYLQPALKLKINHP